MRAILSSVQRRFGTTLLYAPLAGHLLATLVIGFGFVIPGSPIEGINIYTLGFLGAVLGFIPAYVSGIAIAKRLRKDG